VRAAIGTEQNILDRIVVFVLLQYFVMIGLEDGIPLLL
jgi:hypothetical protein